MSCLEHSLRMIKYAIPEIILEKAFPPDLYGPFTFTAHTLMDRVREEVIRDRVIPDIDIVGGSLEYIPMVSGQITHSKGQVETAVFYSDRFLAGREITSVHAYMTNVGYQSHYMPGGIGYGSSGSGGSDLTETCSPCGDNRFCNESKNITIKQAQTIAMNTLASVIDPANTSVSLIAKNTILLRYTQFVFGGVFMVVLSNDPYLNNISNRSWQTFGELAILACKSTIYNKIAISLGRTKLLEGVESTVLTEIIDEYRDAEKQYQDFLRTRWMKVSFMNDNNSYHPFVRSFLTGHGW